MASINSSPGRSKFGEVAAMYDLARPGYPHELYEWLAAECRLGEESDCFEIGPGTGQATSAILDLRVRSIVAIEPDIHLGAHLADTLANPRLTLVQQRFEAFDLGASTFDFGFAAMSFHWLQRMKAFARIRSALRPGGHFAMWWNVFHDPARPDAFDSATAHLFNGLEQDPDATARRPAFGIDIASRTGEMRSAGFTDVRHRLFSQTISFSAERIAMLYATFSRVRMAPAATRERLLEETQRIVDQQFGGSVDRTITCSAFLGRHS